MSMNHKIETLLFLLDEYKALGIADLIKPVFDPINDISDLITERLYQAILTNNKLNYAEYGALLGVSEATIKRRLGELRKAGMIVRMGSNKSGYWEVISLKDRKEGRYEKNSNNRRIRNYNYRKYSSKK